MTAVKLCDGSEFQNELTSLTNKIHATMKEVAAIRHPLMNQDRVETAVDELAAIVAATEIATEQILVAAEKLEMLAGRLEPEHGDEMAVTITSIYEACNFQDITGQRISKVMGLLRDVDDRLIAIIDHFGADRFAQIPAPQKIDPNDTNLLNGPALNDSGLEQNSIDVLFG